jgi:hypothetical protein
MGVLWMSLRQQICQAAEQLKYEDRLAVLSVLKLRAPALVNDGADGSRVNLELLDEHVVAELWALVESRLKNIGA